MTNYNRTSSNYVISKENIRENGVVKYIYQLSEKNKYVQLIRIRFLDFSFYDVLGFVRFGL